MALFKNGHEPDAKDTHGRTPLSYAAQSGREAEVKLLLAKDSVDPDSRSRLATHKDLPKTFKKPDRR